MPTPREPEVGAPGFADNAVLRPGQRLLLGAFARSPLAETFYASTACWTTPREDSGCAACVTCYARASWKRRRPWPAWR